jgi:hypothetical protein
MRASKDTCRVDLLQVLDIGLRWSRVAASHIFCPPHHSPLRPRPRRPAPHPEPIFFQILQDGLRLVFLEPSNTFPAHHGFFFLEKQVQTFTLAQIHLFSSHEPWRYTHEQLTTAPPLSNQHSLSRNRGSRMRPHAAATMAEALRLPSPSPSTMNDTSGILALYRLLGKASSLPCSSGAAAFLSLIPSENNWFPLALEALLPALQDQNIQVCIKIICTMVTDSLPIRPQPPQRILAAYLLDALYASHDHLNPFHDHILQIFESERAAAVMHSRSFDLVGSPELGLGPPQEGGSGLQAENEQLVWVLWKILKGEGEHVSRLFLVCACRTDMSHLAAWPLLTQYPLTHSFTGASSRSASRPPSPTRSQP